MDKIEKDHWRWSAIVTFRTSHSEKEKLIQLGEESNLRPSEILRNVLHGYLKSTEKNNDHE